MAEKVNTPTISLNLRPYCNLLIPYVKTSDIDKDALLADVAFWGEVLTGIDEVMSNHVKVTTVTVPDNIEVVTNCPKCGGTNLSLSTGIAKASGKEWFAFDCQDCQTERNGTTYPTRTFTKLKPLVSQAELMGIPEDEDEVPF